MSGASKIATLRAKLIEHLEAAHAVADEAAEEVVTYFVECALAELRAKTQPTNLDWPR